MRIYTTTTNPTAPIVRDIEGACCDVVQCMKFSSDVGTPNITGTAQGDEFPTTEMVQLDGAFYKIGTFGDTETGGGHGSASIGFDASRVCKIYGSSSIVQPQSLMLLPCIKI